MSTNKHSEKNERLMALRLLDRLLNEHLHMSHLLTTDSYSPFSKALIYGVCRQYYRLAFIASKLVTKKPSDQQVWVALLMGLYELQYLNKPAHAAVQETVSLLDKLKKPWAKGLLNAVLRRFCREKEFTMNACISEPDFIAGHPTWFVQALQKDWPEHWQMILAANDEHPPMTLRVNKRQESRETYLNRLETVGRAAQGCSRADMGIHLTLPCEVNELPGFADGDVSVQDEAAQLVLPLLDLKPNLRILDACCAPGGKTCHILETESQLAACIALDNDEHRLVRAQENLKRLNLSADVIHGDGLKPSQWWDGRCFDRILLDAPCSATGVIRRHPDIKLLRTPKDVQEITRVQAQLLEALWPLLSSGGRLVYTTCSVLKQENEEQIGHFLSQHSDAQLLPIQVDWGVDCHYGRQLLPGELNADGFFYSCLQKG